MHSNTIIIFYLVAISNYTCVDLPLIETPTQRDVLKQLIIIYHLWYNIGIALKVSHANLSSQLQSVHSDQLKLQRVLEFWIKEQCTDNISWTTIIIAVESNMVRQKNLGKKLSKFYIYDSKL